MTVYVSWMARSTTVYVSCMARTMTVYIFWTMEQSPYQPFNYKQNTSTYNNAHAQMCDFIIAYINYIMLTRAILDLALGSVRINAI